MAAPHVAGTAAATAWNGLAVAGVLVAVLLAILAFFDRLATPDEPEAETGK